ncbi:hypothetical protein HPB50_011267 [Hyalomma asiaticum]|uniref:Uncharacterized protein n=1 Tax=Hyalomma asiaticum TaxID=266040 RepID=A0ACB7S6B9_HYAAI|nr:hypothetical protein HPB50_011267 [Hyalomma asiaticum]
MQRDRFPVMFRELEDQSQRLGIASIGVSVATMQDAYVRHLSPGMLLRDTVTAFHVGIETARTIIIETCTVLRKVLSPLYMKIYFETDHVDFIVKATCVLHNFLSSDAAATYCPPGYTDCQDMFGTVSGDTRRQGGTTTAVFGLQGAKATAMRQKFTAYFAKEVQVPWQWKLPELTSS